MSRLPSNKPKIPDTKIWNAIVTSRTRVKSLLLKREALLERANGILGNETNDLIVYLRDVYGDGVHIRDFTGSSDPGKYACTIPVILQRFDAIDCIDCFVDYQSIFVNCTDLLGEKFCLEIELASPAKFNAIFINFIRKLGLYPEEKTFGVEEERWKIIKEYCDVLTQFSTISDRNGIFLIPPVKLLMDTPYTKRFYHISGKLAGEGNSFIGINERRINENLYCHRQQADILRSEV